MSRDTIDLAAMVHDGRLPGKAVAHTLGREGRLKRCIDAMGVDIPQDILRTRLAAFAGGVTPDA